ncbi:hypothetical protein DRW03_21300 [Corallococcus sp. H22C18031201]|nr:hypothetical protein DRW03_21300 [Corallococcus sp. H22C18031201]
MARHRDHQKEEDEEVADVVSLDPLATYTPLRKPGPATTLTERLGSELCRKIAAGHTLRDAAALVGTTDTVVQGWLTRGRDAVERNEESPYTAFLMEYQAAGAHFRHVLEEAQQANIGNRAFNDKYVRWRLAVSDPKNFTIPRQGGPTGTDGGAFDLISPEDAQKTLVDRLSRFLGDEEKKVALPPPAAPSDSS